MHDPVPIDSIESLYGAVEGIHEADNKALLMLWLRSWLSQVCSFDPISGLALHTGLDELASLIHSLEGDEALKKYSEDRIHRIIAHSFEAIVSIMGHAREKIIREHAMLPIHAAMEVDIKSVQWLGRKPGRTIREKLAGKPYLKAVRRRSSVDTAENQLLKALMIRLEQVLDKRQSALNLSPTDISEELRVAIQRWMRTEEASNIGAWNNLPPNNILLQDKLYRKIWDAWLWVQRIDESIKGDEYRIFKDALSVVFWGTFAQLTHSGYFRFVQQPVLIDYDSYRITPSSEIHGCFFPPSELKFKGMVKHLHARGNSGHIVSDSGTELFFNKSNLGNNIEFSSLSVGTSVEFNIVRNRSGKCADGIVLSRSGIPLKVSTVEDEYHFSTVDMHICLKIEHNRLIIQQARDLKREYEITPFSLMDAPKSVLSMILGNAQPRIFNISENVPQQLEEHCIVDLCSIRPEYSDQIGTLKRLPFRFLLQQWLKGGNIESIVDCGLSQAIKLSSDIEAISMRTLFESNSQLTNAARSDASMIFAKKLHDHITSDRLTYLIPDWVNDFEMEAIRKSINFHFGNSTPLPRSIAAVFAWQATKDFSRHQVSENDIVLVIDTMQGGYSITPVEARYESRVKKTSPETSGIIWERHPAAFMALPGQDHPMAEILSKDGCSIAQEILSLFGSDGILSEGGELSISIDEDWYHLPELDIELVRQSIEQFPMSADLIAETVNSISGDFGSIKVFVLPLEESIKMPNTIGPYVHIKEPLNIVEGGLVLENWQSRAGTISLWRDHLPELSIRIVQHGHFEDFYLVQDTAVTPQRGTSVNIPVKETFTLPAGQNHYSFPLRQGQGNRELKYVAYLTSPAFPLAEDVNCDLMMTYTYGADDPYILKFVPVDSKRAGFNSVSVEWRSVQERATSDLVSLPVPGFPERRNWSDFQRFPKDDGRGYSDLLKWVLEEFKKLDDVITYGRISGPVVKWFDKGSDNIFCFIEETFIHKSFLQLEVDHELPEEGDILTFYKIKNDRGQFHAEDVVIGDYQPPRCFLARSLRFPILTIWNNDRSLSDPGVPIEFREAMYEGIAKATSILDSDIYPQSLREELLLLLSCLHRDTPDLVIDRLLSTEQFPEFRKLFRNIGFALGGLELPWQLELFKAVSALIDSHDEKKYSLGLKILAIAIWRNENLIARFSPDDIEKIANKLYLSLKSKVDHGEIITIHRTFKPSVSLRMELLLALMRSRGIEGGNYEDIFSPTKDISLRFVNLVDSITKLVVENKVEISTRIRLLIQKPDIFSETPDLLYALRMYLTGDSGANTISVTSVSDE